MPTATHSLRSDVAPETLFGYIVDPGIVPPGIVVRTVHESPAGVGNVYEWTYRLLGIPIRGVTVYTRYVPHRLFVCKHLGLVGATATFALEPDDGGGTRLTRCIDFRVRIPLLGTLLEELMVAAARPDSIRTVACPKLVDFFVKRGVERHRARA
jgi:hypothetical protein